MSVAYEDGDAQPTETFIVESVIVDREQLEQLLQLLPPTHPRNPGNQTSLYQQRLCRNWLLQIPVARAVL
jgi:hypothetical protein